MSHNIIPQRPTAAPNGVSPPSPAGIRRFQRRGLDLQTLQAAPLGASVFAMAMPSPASLKRPSTPSALGFGLDFGQAPASASESGMAPPTPTNSSRATSDQRTMMMPRSSRSMRQNVLQARGAEEVDAVALPIEMPARPATSSGMAARAGFVGVASLGTEVVSTSVTTSTWIANGLSTPKNLDRRDLNGSVEQMIPLWRGSASDAAPLHVLASRPQTALVSSPTHTVQLQRGYPTAPSPPMNRMQAPSLCEEDAGIIVAAPLLMGTPKHSERFNMSGGVRVMMPRSNHSIRSRLIEVTSDGSPAAKEDATLA